MKPRQTTMLARRYVVLALLAVPPAYAHDPVFGLGPHTLYKGGVEIHLGNHQEKARDERSTESELQLKY